MSLLKHHWFSLIIWTIISFFFFLFMLILLSPRQDIQKRGFIPCTETMVKELINCEQNKFICLLKVSLRNSWCDLKVVSKGFANWSKGIQKTPWSNYIFIPELPEDPDFDKKAREEYLKNNPDMATEMQQLKKLSEELENESMQETNLTPEDKPNISPRMGFE